MDHAFMPCNGNNHPSNCQCDFGKKGDNRQKRNQWRSWGKKTYQAISISPNARCPECQKPVWYIPCQNGGGFYSEVFGPPWTKHPCTNKPPAYSPYTRSGKTKLKSKPTDWQRAGWLAFEVRYQERFGIGTIIHGAVMDSPTIIHLGIQLDVEIDPERPTLVRFTRSRTAELSYYPAKQVEPIETKFFSECKTPIDLALRLSHENDAESE